MEDADCETDENMRMTCLAEVKGGLSAMLMLGMLEHTILVD